MSLILLLGLMSIAEPQSAPTPLIHYRPPVSGETQSRFVCGDQQVRFKISVDESQVSIVSYSGGAGEASAEQIAQWNAWLTPMRRMVSQRFVCIGGNENLEIQGTRTQVDGAITVSVYWHEGQLARYPDPYELHQDLH